MLYPDSGKCDDYQTRFYYDAAMNECHSFKYHGCDGNRNNFMDEHNCMKYCSRLHDDNNDHDDGDMDRPDGDDMDRPDKDDMDRPDKDDMDEPDKDDMDRPDKDDMDRPDKDDMDRPDEDGVTMMMGDEFSLFDESKWNVQKMSEDMNGEQFYTDRSENIKFEEGHLVINPMMERSARLY